MRYKFRDAPKMHATIISWRIPPCSSILLFRSVGRTIPSIPNGENPIATRRKSCRDTPPSSGKPDRCRPKVRAGRGYGRRFACPMPDPLRQGGCVKGTDDRRISRRGDEIASGPESAFRLKPLHCATARGRLIIRKPAALRDEAISSPGRPLAESGTRSDSSVLRSRIATTRAAENSNRCDDALFS